MKRGLYIVLATLLILGSVHYVVFSLLTVQS